MKQRLPSITLAAAICLLAVQCAQAPQELSIAYVDKQAEALKSTILNSKSEYKVAGNVYYVSNDGDDARDGLSEKAAIASLDKVNDLDLKRGDVVLFRRGDIWRGCIHTRPGVTYSAYGKGPKPTLYGSPFDAAKEGTWSETDTPCVYRYDTPVKLDVGVIVFNEGEANSFKVMKRIMPDGTTTHVDTGEPFAGPQDLRRDLDMWHEPSDGFVYLRSDAGNPAQRFNSIEMAIRRHGFFAVDDITVDNFRIKYVGTHGIGSLTTTGLTVTNCEIGWIGGCIQRQDPRRNIPTRYGNGVEIFGGCGQYTIRNCWVYQCYDAGITHQYSTGGADEAKLCNVTYEGNLIEDCVYDIEYFMGLSTNNSDRYMENVAIKDNILRRAGYGFGCQRPDKTTPAVIKTWRHWNMAYNFTVTGNIIDRGKPSLMYISASETDWLPKFDGNTYIALRGKQLHVGAPADPYEIGDDFEDIVRSKVGDMNAKVLVVTE